MTMPELEGLLAVNILDIQFNRRHPKQGYSNVRRMLCTNNQKALNSLIGKITLKYHPPKGVGLPYDASRYGLVVCWDIMWQDWRQIPIESAVVVSNFPVDKFWDQRLWEMRFLTMTPSQKKVYMGG